jgi:TPR repeat protein
MRYKMGLGVKRSDERARLYFIKACYRHNDGKGCYYLANIYAKGRELSELDGQSISIYKKACELGYKPACIKIKK